MVTLFGIKTNGINELTLNCNFEQPMQSVGVDIDEIFRYLPKNIISLPTKCIQVVHNLSIGLIFDVTSKSMMSNKNHIICSNFEYCTHSRNNV